MNKIRLQNAYDFLTLIVLAGFSINTLINHITNDGVLSIQHYVGFVAVISGLIIRLINRRIGRYFIGFQLILGSFNLINYTISTMTIMFTLRFVNTSINSLGIQPLSLLGLVIFYILNFKSINRIIRNIFDDSPEDKAALFKIKRERYEKEFNSYSIAELEDIIKNKKDTYESFARNIMYKVLNEKKNNAL